MNAPVEWRPVNGEFHPFVRTGKGQEIQAVWAPQPGSQEAFLECPITEVLYEGTRGPGKTDALLMAFAQHCGKGYGEDWKGVIFRRTYPELQDVIEKSRKWYKRIWPGAKYNEAKSYWEWPTGELLYFRHFLKPVHYWGYHGHSYPFIGWEELTTWPDDQCFRSMFACSRSTRVGMPRMVRATTNPYGCVPEGDVLTVDRGWVPIQQVRVGEEVYSVDATGAMVSAQVSAVVCKPWNGDIMHRVGSGLYMSFTPDHRFAHLNTDRTSFTLKPFHDLPGQAHILRTAAGWSGVGLGQFAPPHVVSSKRASRITQPTSLAGRDFAELLGWFVSEGSLLQHTDGTFTGFSIAQSKPENRKQIEALFDRCGFTYSISANGYQIWDRHWATFFASLGRNCREKSVPTWFLACDRPILRAFFDAAMKGDGSGNWYYTYSQALAGQMAEIGMKLGYSVYQTQRHRIDRAHPCHEISFANRRTIELLTGQHRYRVDTTCKANNVSRTPYSGNVYCLTVPGTETFFIRQRGCVWLSGNSGHNWVKRRYRLPVGTGRIIGQIITDSRDESGMLEPPRVAIHGYLDENQILMRADPDYKQRISAAARNKNERKAWLEGSWDIVAGGMLDDVWDRAVHCIEPFAIPSTWTVDRAFDWGSSKPFALGWWAESDGSKAPNGKVYPKGTLFLIKQWYGWTGKENEGVKKLAAEIAEEGLKMEKDLQHKVEPGPADPSIFTVENGMCIANDMKANGMTFEPGHAGPGSRKNSAELFRTRLSASLKWPMEAPGLFVFKNCEQWLRTVPVVPRDLKDPDDVDTEAEDHDYDMTRYRIMHKRREIKMQKLTGV